MTTKNKTYSTKIDLYRFPEPGSPTWIKAITEAAQHPGFKLKGREEPLELQHLKPKEQARLEVARATVLQLAIN